MAQANPSRINALYIEGSALQRALTNLNGGGKIVAMTIGPPPNASQEQPSRVSDAIVGTIGWDYPPVMTDTIRGQLQRRISEINAELAGMGVGGI